MALVVLLRGVNVGGHRTFRPTNLTKQLEHLDAVNIGAAGTLVIRKPITTAQLQVEVARRLPFDAQVTICQGRDILRLVSTDPFAAQSVGRDTVRFVSLLFRRPRVTPPLPMRLPAGRNWLVTILAAEHRFVIGLYRRHMKVIGYLGTLDRLFGVPATTRNWNTITAVARVLSAGD